VPLKTALQIVPKTPGSFDGVGDYALVLAQKLRDLFDYQTIFASRDSTGAANVGGFEVRPFQVDGPSRLSGADFDHVILHYVNYGYQARGIPFGLLPILRELRRSCRGGFLTIFHELYASGPPWKSSFWLQPSQKRITRTIAQLSRMCLVSSESMLRQLQALSPDVEAIVSPVLSNFGEPELAADQFSRRDPHHWVICGGTALIERSLESFLKIWNRIQEQIVPRRLSVFGGNDSPAVHAFLARLHPQIHTDYLPRIPRADASRILSESSFVWLDYFHRRGVPADILLKSTAFAAACAHGAIPVLAHRASAISVHSDPLPGPFFVEPSVSELPDAASRAETAARFYHWYRRHAASNHLAHQIERALELSRASRNGT
jgi:hypothetical protein